MPEIFKDLVLYGEKPNLEKIINPLQDGLLWLRGMDMLPKIFKSEQLEQEILHL